MKISSKVAMELLEVPVAEVLKRKGVGHKFITALAEEYRKMLLARIEAYNELYTEMYSEEEEYKEETI